MSEIKNVPGAPLGPGGIDPTNQPDTSQRPHHGSRFRDIARRMREKELEAELQAQQGNTQQPAAGVTDPSKADALQRKAQLLGGQANPQAGASPLTNAKITPGSTP